ncbi:MAG TPA: PIN domain-containing protein [Kiritimatiellia bacterium]|jgi:predicted nucleic acid-binding protein|nr:PIN domain-containing protein [Kiritimatiellia bacterium]HPO37261.1 PIN domain-containing protein [Kiritimatiellia bacterium]HQA37943.1 PIN domain-containing protein [Kiritimatiellia bacterium]HQQ90585.1 PIN domain-containing protein [Kiritimatiellia bacterium]
MKVFCDTSVLVAGSVRHHPHFNRAQPILEAASLRKDEYLISAHSVTEVYSVLTNLPVQPKIVPAEAQMIVEANVLSCFRRVAVTVKMYEHAASRCAGLGLSGGIIYDALLLECARSVSAERIYTFNIRGFQRLAPGLASRIAAP